LQWKKDKLKIERESFKKDVKQWREREREKVKKKERNRVIID
jgi:hypothetical protein